MALTLNKKQVFAVMAEARAAIRSHVPYYGKQPLELVGSKGTRFLIYAVIVVENGMLSITMEGAGEGNNHFGKISMPIEIFPGTAEGFLQGLTATDPDAPIPSPISIIAPGPHRG